MGSTKDVKRYSTGDVLARAREVQVSLPAGAVIDVCELADKWFLDRSRLQERLDASIHWDSVAALVVDVMRAVGATTTAGGAHILTEDVERAVNDLRNAALMKDDIPF